MTVMMRTTRLSLGAAALGLVLAGCAGDTASIVAPVAPAAAPRSTGLDKAVEREHKQLVKAFGGEYRAPQMTALLTEVTNRLVKATERPEETYRITLLDSPSVNAFALPTGRLYVTRGLLALANDTSEIAAVMAHEIAHVTLRHAAARSELELRSALVSRVVADVLKDPVAGAVVQDESRVDIARFSRQQELEADQISVKTLAAAGYDPYGAARFLTSLNRSSESRASATGDVQKASIDRLSSHPPTPQRISEAKLAARRIGAPGIGGDGRDVYLAAAEGITYGDDPADGVVRGRRFIHARLGVTFTAPEGIALENTSRAVLGASRDGQRRLLFDAIETTEGQTLSDVLTSTWTDAIETGSIENLTVNGNPAATATSRGRDWSFRMAAVKIGNATYRLIMAFRSLDANAERHFRTTLDSLRGTDASDLSAITPQRIRLVTAEPGDTAETIVRRTGAAEGALDRFLLLNGLTEGAALKPGERYKAVMD